MNGDLGTAEGRSDLVRLALRLIVEAALEGEVADALGASATSAAKAGRLAAADTIMSVTAERPPSFGTTDMDEVQSTNVAESIVTVLAAIELSKTTWLLAIHDPTTNKVSRRRSDGGDVEALIGIVQRCRRGVQAHAGRAGRDRVRVRGRL